MLVLIIPGANELARYVDPTPLNQNKVIKIKHKNQIYLLNFNYSSLACTVFFFEKQNKQRTLIILLLLVL
jgi:hypothetical protein